MAGIINPVTVADRYGGNDLASLANSCFFRSRAGVAGAGARGERAVLAARATKLSCWEKSCLGMGWSLMAGTTMVQENPSSYHSGCICR